MGVVDWKNSVEVLELEVSRENCVVRFDNRGGDSKRGINHKPKFGYFWRKM